MSANKQIGWSQEAYLLYGVSQQLQRLYQLIGHAASTPVNVAPLELNNTNKTAWNNGPGDIDTNTSFGMFAFDSNTTGVENTAFGYNALTANTTGPYNTAIGKNALMSNVGAQQNTAVGVSALELNVSGSFCSALGAFALSRHTSGNSNTAVGVGALKGSTVSTQNTAIGYFAMGGLNGQNTTGGANTAIGYQAGCALTTGANNILIENIITGTSGVTTGSNNIIINGVGFSGIVTGSNNVLIGGLSGVADLSSQVIIATGDGIRRLAFDPTGQMTISNTQPLGAAAATEKLLVRDTAAGAVKTLDYIVIESVTTTARTAAQLNALYATAKAGFRAIFTAITPNPIQYTKTATGWASTTLTNVT